MQAQETSIRAQGFEVLLSNFSFSEDPLLSKGPFRSHSSHGRSWAYALPQDSETEAAGIDPSNQGSSSPGWVRVLL